MKNLNLVVGMLVIVLLAGCAGNREAVLKATAQKRQDVYQIALQSHVDSGKSLLKIEFPVKPFKARFINTYSKHSDPPYTVVVNIDGQPIELTDEPVYEDLLGNQELNPEVGRGWRYIFKKNLQLSPGDHRITIAVPLSDIVLEKELSLKEGENLLKITPVYRSSTYQKTKYPRYENGIQELVVNLNSRAL